MSPNIVAKIAREGKHIVVRSLYVCYSGDVGKLDERLEWLRAISIVAVVLIHVVAPTVSTGDEGSVQWYIASILNGLSRWTVPIFIMISGALLFAKPVKSLKAYYLKVWWRIGLPLVIFSALYMLWRVLFGVTSPEGAFNFLVSGRPYYHLHFMFIIIGLQLVHPFLQRLSYLPVKQLASVASLAMVVMVGITLLVAYSGYDLYYYSRWVPFVGYYIMGYLVYRYQWYNFLSLPVMIILFLLVSAVTSILYIYTSIQGIPTVPGLIIDTNMPLVMLASFLVFSIGLRMTLPPGRAVWLAIAGASYGIYLLHPFVLDIVRYAIPRDHLVLNLLALPVVLGLSWYLVKVLRSRTIGKVLLGEYTVQSRAPNADAGRDRAIDRVR